MEDPEEIKHDEERNYALMQKNFDVIEKEEENINTEQPCDILQ